MNIMHISNEWNTECLFECAQGKEKCSAQVLHSGTKVRFPQRLNTHRAHA